MLSFGKQGNQFNIETWGALLPQSFEHIMVDICFLCAPCSVSMP